MLSEENPKFHTVSRKSNGHIRSIVRNRRLKAHLNGRHSWRHEFYFCDEKNHIVHYKTFSPQTYWKKAANRSIRRRKWIFDNAYYRKMVDIFALW